MADQQIIRPSAGLKPLPQGGGPNVCLLSEGDQVRRIGVWDQVEVISGPHTGAQGWLHSVAIGDIPPPPPPPPPPNPSGVALPLGDLLGWKQIFTDDFTRDVALGHFPNDVADRWAAYPPGWKDTRAQNNPPGGTYRPDTVLEVSGHCLRWHLHSAGGQICVATPIPIIGPRIKAAGAPYDHFAHGQLYGRVAVCARSDSLAGFKTAFMLWPDSGNWPHDGEIDYPESDLNKAILGAYMHRQSGVGPSDQDGYHTPCDRTGWHVFVTEWLKDSLTFILDGVVVGHSTVRVPNTAMHVNLQAETVLGKEPLPDPATAGVLEVDWIAIYSPST